MKRYLHRGNPIPHEMPPGAILNAATLELCGKAEGTISGVLRLVSYEESEIVLTLCDRRLLRIYGQGLSIALITRDVLRIHGKIHGCAFFAQGEAKTAEQGENK